MNCNRRTSHLAFSGNILSALAMAVFIATPAWSQGGNQSSNQGNETTATGTVISSTRNTLVVYSGSDYQLYVFDQDTVKPARIANGSTVRIRSTAGGEPGTRVANNVTVVSAPAAGAAPAPPPADQPISPEIRRVERDIEREARRYQAGVRGGFSLDPELVMIGVQAQLGPFFSSDVFFRPSVEFGLGEVTGLFALNPEIIYRPRITPRGRQHWYPYFGAGPGFTFLHQSFHTTSTSSVGSRVDFGQFHSSTGLNILGGVRAIGGKE